MSAKIAYGRFAPRKANPLKSAIEITASAAKYVASVLMGEPPGSFLRIAVNGGGCSGFQYAYEIDTVRADDDLVIRRDGATIAIDQASLEFLKGARIDYVDDLIGAAFKIDNPNAVASCGCGTSFAV